MDNDPLQDPFGGMAAGAAAIHEMFVSLVGAGFSEPQALWLTAAQVCGLKPPDPPQVPPRT